MKKRHILVINIFIFINLIFGQIERPKIGLALSGGGALGFAHIGILEKIDSLEIPIDYLAGTSMGGLVGALYASGYNSADILELILKIDWKVMLSDSPDRSKLPYFEKIEDHKYQFNVGISELYKPDKLGLIEGQNIEFEFSRLMQNFATEKDFDKLPIPFRCISVDILTGNEVVMHKGSLPLAMRATMSVPSIFAPVEYGDSLLIDGGILNNMPVDVVKSMGADFVLAVSVRNPNKEKENLHGFLDILMQAYNIVGLKQIHKQAQLADIYIECMIANLSATDFSKDKAIKIINIGRKYANQNIDKLLQIKKMVEKQNKINNKSKILNIDTISIYDNISYRDEYVKSLLQIKKEMTIEDLVDRLNFVKDSLHLKEIKYSFNNTFDNSTHLSIKIKEKKPKIFGVYIYGNRIHSFGFIYRLLGIKPGTRLNLDLLESRIGELYGLGYFKKITYDLDFAKPGYIKLNINVIENPRRKIRFGLQYNNNYDLIAAISGQFNNVILPGLRMEDELQFFGKTKLSGEIFYPSRTLDIPIYPFVEFVYSDIPYILYNTDGNKLASYNYITFNSSAGFGLLYKNFEHISVYLNNEWIRALPDIAMQYRENFKNFKENLTSIRFDYNADLLDDYLYPRKGLYIDGNFEIADEILYKSDRNYLKYSSSIDYYYTFKQILTFHLNGHYCYSKDAPEYKYFWIGGANSFIGIDYNQLLVKKMTYFRSDVYLRLIENFRGSLIYNYAYDYEPFIIDPDLEINKNISAWGMGIEYKTPIGPVKIILSNSINSITDKLNGNWYFYFTAGYCF